VDWNRTSRVAPRRATPRSINELVEAAAAYQLSRALGRWERLDLIRIDELGYVPLAETACELKFQVIAERVEKAAVIVTTNLLFSEWSQVIPNQRLCKAPIDRLTDHARIITTKPESYRFRRTTAQQGGKGISMIVKENRRPFRGWARIHGQTQQVLSPQGQSHHARATTARQQLRQHRDRPILLLHSRLHDRLPEAGHAVIRTTLDSGMGQKGMAGIPSTGSS
jgi:hypothetical protein